MGPAGERKSHVVEARHEKLQALEERNVAPYAYRYDVTHHAADARTAFEAAERAGALGENGQGASVRLGGRVVSLRAHGKSTFADLTDRSGRIQLYFKADRLGEAYPTLVLLDIGDWLGVEGTLFRTRMGEVTVQVSGFELLAKSIRPLPMGKEEVDEATGERRVYSGFADLEQRYRQRYADLAVNPEVRDVFLRRTRIVSAIRRFLDERGFVEVETPVLQPLYGGASARPFVTHHNALDMQLYMRIADELYLKRLIVGGLERPDALAQPGEILVGRRSVVVAMIIRRVRPDGPRILPSMVVHVSVAKRDQPATTVGTVWEIEKTVRVHPHSEERPADAVGIYVRKRERAGGNL